MFFYSADLNAQKFVQDSELQHYKDGIDLKLKPEQIYWDDELVFISSKKAYIIYRKSEGLPCQKLLLENSKIEPRMSVSKG